MHSRIFQVSRAPISRMLKMDESRYEELNFYDEIADYVIYSQDVAGDLRWLGEMPGLKVDCDKKILKIEDKKAYFASVYERFKKYCTDINDVSLEEFVDEKLKYKLYSLNSYYDDKFGFYVDDGDIEFGLMTFDSFVRKVKEGSEWHLGTVFDYHS